MTPRPDHAREVRNALHDPRRLCKELGLLKGAEEQAGGGLTVFCPHHRERTPSCSVTRGEDGTIRVRCFGCDFTGDALTLIAEVRGWSLQTHFRDVLAEGARIAGEHVLEQEISGGAERAEPGRSPVEPPPPVEPKTYPPREEVTRLWASARRVTDDEGTSRYLESRAISPEQVSSGSLARVIPRDAVLPRWARYRGKAEHAQNWLETGHRLILRMWDHRGACQSVRAWRLGDHESPKRLPPSGHRATDLVLANASAVELLAGHNPAPARIFVVEGEPDFLTIATRTESAVLGLISGAWSKAFAARIPAGSEVIVRTHHDQAGDKYAKQVIDSLKTRVALSRSAA